MTDDANSNQQQTISLVRFPHLCLYLNTAKGRGVFASKDIPAGTTIDTCPVLVLDPTENSAHIEQTSMHHYTYNWPYSAFPNDNASRGKTTQAVIFGLGSMFNHSTQRQNVGWRRDTERRIIVYSALRDIRAGEELCISYGDRLTFRDADDSESNSAQRENGVEMLGKIRLG